MISQIRGEEGDEMLDKQSYVLVRLKHQFIYDGGIENLKKVMEVSFDHEHYEVYFFCVSMIQPLTFNMDLVNSKKQVLLSENDWVKSHDEVMNEFRDAKYVELLTSQVNTLYERRSRQLKFLAPVMLSLRALVQQREDVRRQLVDDSHSLKNLIEMMS